MKIYLAGKFGDKPKLAKYRDQLKVTPGVTQLLESTPKKVDPELYEETRTFEFACQTNIFYFYGLNKPHIHLPASLFVSRSNDGPE